MQRILLIDLILLPTLVNTHLISSHFRFSYSIILSYPQKRKKTLEAHTPKVPSLSSIQFSLSSSHGSKYPIVLSESPTPAVVGSTSTPHQAQQGQHLVQPVTGNRGDDASPGGNGGTVPGFPSSQARFLYFFRNSGDLWRWLSF